MSSLLIKPIVQHHRSRVSPIQLRDFPLAYLRDSSRFPRRRPFIDLNRHTPSGQSRVERITQLRTDGVHCRESASIGPVNLSSKRVLPWQVAMDQLICASLSHTHFWYEVGMLRVPAVIYVYMSLSQLQLGGKKTIGILNRLCATSYQRHSCGVRKRREPDPLSYLFHYWFNLRQ